MNTRAQGSAPRPFRIRSLFSPVRCLAAAVSIGALLLIASRIDRAAVAATFSHLRPGWFLAAGLALMVSLSLGGWRWHQMLRVTGADINLATSLRLTFVGHTFSALLFGAAVSDVAKATLYSRWHGFPMARILAASALDRTAGVVSTLLYGLATLGIGIWAAPQVDWSLVKWKGLPGWLPAAALAGLAGAAALLCVRERWMPWARHFAREVLRATRELRARPGLSITAILAGLAIQVMISAVLGCCLNAIHPGPLPWVRLAWTFPVIGVAASLPVTISGAGARDGAAIVLWSAFGISSSQAFSACLLTLFVNLGWAVVGMGFAWAASRTADRSGASGPGGVEL